MSKPFTDSQSSTDYFGDEDSQFLEALQNIVLPGDNPPVEQPQAQNESIVIANDTEDQESPPPPTQPGLKRHYSDVEPEPETVHPQDETVYGSSHFGQFGEYMRRKRAKLQIQNQALEDKTGRREVRSGGIFEGIAIYVNGWTRPSVQELRKLIVENGGIFQPYLDRKSIVTHVITCSLTPAKVKEFKSMKVVEPKWLTESISAGVLLPWTDYIFKPNDRVDNTQGQSTKRQTITSTATVRTNTSSVGPQKSKPTATNASAPSPIIPSAKPLPPDEMDPLHTTDPSTEPDARRVPGYAADTSNTNAQRVMANPEWRKAHTSIAPDFIEGYYKNSRLHHLSTWKSELRALVMEAQEQAEARMSATPEAAPRPVLNGISMRGEHLQVKTSPKKWKGKGKAKAGELNERVIMHCDFDCFFVSAGLVSRPELKGKPVVVCHSQGTQGAGSSTSEIASCSYEARDFGIRNGMSLQQARKLCSAIVTIPYEFERQGSMFSLKFYTVLMSFADDLQAVSVDEALIEVTNAVRARAEILEMESGDNHGKDPAKEVAESIRDAVRGSTNCEVSIGIAHNILLARLATRRAKPAKSYHLLPEELDAFLAPLEVSDLHGFGYNTKQRTLEKLGTSKLGELGNKSKAVLCYALGKTTGETLYNAIRGIDEKQLESSKERKSVSCEINYGIRFENNEQAEKFIYQMAEEVKRRLDEVKMLGRMITLKVMKRDPTAPVEPPKFLGHGKCDSFNKQGKLAGFGGNAVNDDKIIGEHAWRLLKSFNFDPKELRGIGIQIQKLEPAKSGSSSIQGVQSVLPFKKVEGPPKERHSSPNKDGQTNFIPDVDKDEYVDLPSSPKPSPKTTGSSTDAPKKDEYVDLPSFSQVDMSIFEALPRELREELETEYKRRSGSPHAAGGANIAGPSHAVSSTALQKRQPSHPLRNAITNAKPGIFPQQSTSTKETNYKRIAQQFAPRHGTSIYANKALLRALGLDKPKKAVRVTEAQLQDLNIDPEVFAMLPVKIQREQLVRARIIKKDGFIPDAPTQRKILKPAKSFMSPSRRRRRGPAPKAVYIQPPILRQQGKEKQEKLCYFETEDIQSVIQKWVTGYRHWAPKEKDIEFFSKYLLQCMESKEGDAGTERAVAILKWWLVLLRRIWGKFEEVESVEVERSDPNERAAVAWWNAFREVKRRLDEVIKRRFGGKLSLK
ncbi:DNA repair protein [Macrolepiota fuliginosa MF-IS2]|uniref:DNA repair protein REV1 n=1 Tax=Macrolepiota fuliginosa MF-IS2 TaxID=1400762 RepID=A0A9P6CA09_9AGAR|nr:DNA repair protein [Macrolepiota fuliginosa MF-IS2]